MKKLLICFVLATVAIAGCEGTCHLDLEIKNQTDSEIIIQLKDADDSQVIAPGSKQLIYSRSGLCDYSGLPEDGDYGWQSLVISGAIMTIGDENITDKIWMREYWDFSKTAKYHGTYTLTVTDELLDSLLSEQNN